MPTITLQVPYQELVNVSKQAIAVDVDIQSLIVSTAMRIAEEECNPGHCVMNTENHLPTNTPS